MISLEIVDSDKEFALEYAEKQNIGGFSNLSKNDLAKASRLDFQISGLWGEIAWNRYRFKSIDNLKKILDFKHENLRPNRLGDGGFDDSITHNDKTRLVDIKTSHVENEGRIQHLNLIIPPREFHKNMIYVCAFTVGKSRREVDRVILAGWEINECITKKWAYDNTKYCVPVKELRDIKELDIYIK